MTTTSAALQDQMDVLPTALVHSACIRHGLLDGGHKDCPTCGRQAYQLDDDGDRATLRAFRKASLTARVRNAAIGGYVAFTVAKSAVLFALGAGIGLELVSTHGAVFAAACAAGAYLLRKPSEHRLDGLLKRV